MPSVKRRGFFLHGTLGRNKSENATIEIFTGNANDTSDLSPDKIIEDLNKIKHHSETNATLLRRLINEHYAYERQLQTGKKIKQVQDSDILKLRSLSPSHRAVIFSEILNLLESMLKTKTKN